MADKIMKRVRAKGRGWVFTPKHFIDFGTRGSVDMALSRLAQAGEKAGLPAELAARLARATVAGSGELLNNMPEDAATLRRNVSTAASVESRNRRLRPMTVASHPVIGRMIALATR